MNEPGSYPTPVSSGLRAAPEVRAGGVPGREQLWRDFLGRAADGNRDAFAALYDATSSLVYAVVLRIVANRADAEEVTLDVYVQVWRDARHFDGARGGVSSWLVMIARSRALDRLRSSESRQKREAGSPEPDSPSDAPSPEALSAMSQDRRAVAGAMASLAPEQRRLIDLAYFHGMTQSEISEHLGLPLGTVKTRVRLGMVKLRELLAERRVS
jgi:RNA polymerase sigma-70 factor, ECF subfamily